MAPASRDAGPAQSDLALMTIRRGRNAVFRGPVGRAEEI